MTLPSSVRLCDVVELAAMSMGSSLSPQDLAKMLFPSKRESEVNADIREALEVSMGRRAVCEIAYPFDCDVRRIEFNDPKGFSPYLFLLLGRSLQFGGPSNGLALRRRFESAFEDFVCWSCRKAGFLSFVLSEPRLARGLPTSLEPALRELAARLGHKATLDTSRLLPHDNDLDVDVVAAPCCGSMDHGGWPYFAIQCATGKVSALQAKVEEGARTFGSVWRDGFYHAACVRAGATPDDLLFLNPVHWDRLGQAGWILDRTRLVYLARTGSSEPVPTLVLDLWNDLWGCRVKIDWRTGWQDADD